jgi:hypothetical protein
MQHFLSNLSLKLLLLAMAVSFYAGAEVESVTIRWTSQLCQKTCGELLEKEFKKIGGVDKINIDISAGQATLTWKPMTAFSFTAINTAMHMVGIAMRDIRIKVSGKIRHSGDTIYIVSNGDNTRFDLINHVVPLPRGQAPVYNQAARKLSPELKQQLLSGESQHQTATIEGPVFMPERMTVPTPIVVDSLTFSDEPKKNAQSSH